MKRDMNYKSILKEIEEQRGFYYRHCHCCMFYRGDTGCKKGYHRCRHLQKELEG